ncbi:cytochrome P450 [Rhizorhabdus dicambivorans]|uniref:Cytochrome P450 n=1 Tax=Rhizorhabdus dicambivorans TaxID=1850238 RepID=A0A2A4FPL7_9SPHN|nr:cytochrome P450 [Rhizorhabdus dicambivorans]ATE66405.1 cytochrome P450 [Rhizorhabdus dicambivorans]PCE40353.1 cytochrome P450 [Rhizorhabdus dicambivorans]
MAESISDLDFHLTDPAFFATGDTHALWRRLRTEDPVHWTRTRYDRGFWSVTRYRDVRKVYLEPNLFSAQRSGATLPLSAEFADPERSPSLKLAMEGAMLPSNDPPRHNKMRRALHDRFLPKAVAELDGFVQSLATDLIGDLIRFGECNFVDDIAARLPAAVIFEIMEIPREDWPMLFRMANMGIAPADADYGGGSALEMRTKALRTIFDYILDLVKQRRGKGGTDLLSILGRVEIDGVPFTDNEIGYNGFMFVAAGQETTRNTIAGGIYELMSQPEEMQRLRANPGLIETLPDEFVRWVSPVTHVLRTATADTSLGGKDIREGDWVVLWNGSANRDESAFPDPDRFDLGRQPNLHLGFGGGDHFCLGAVVARLQIRRIVQAFLDHVEDIELVGPVERVASHQFPGYKRMPVRVTPKCPQPAI